MKKRIFSALLACLMLVASVSMVSAAKDYDLSTYTVGTKTLAELTAINAEIDETYDGYFLPVYVDQFHYDTWNEGYLSGSVRIEFDNSKIEFDSEWGAYTNLVIRKSTTGAPKNQTAGFNPGVEDKGNGLLIGAWLSTTNYMSNYDFPDDGVFFYIPFKVVDGATGTATVTITELKQASATENFTIGTGIAVAEGGIVISEEVTDPDPVATTVKTFPKRFYEVDSQTLTTVGLILEGDDYVETATAGIYANGEAFEAAPIAGAEGKSYILVGLKGVTETSKINLGTATQAYVNLGAEDILGAEVTDYTSEATKVTDGDIDGFSEVE